MRPRRALRLLEVLEILPIEEEEARRRSFSSSEDNEEDEEEGNQEEWGRERRELEVGGLDLIR